MNERRDSSSLRGVRARSRCRRPRSAARYAYDASADGVHFSLSKTSRPVPCRSKRGPGALRCYAAGPWPTSTGRGTVFDSNRARVYARPARRKATSRPKSCPSAVFGAARLLQSQPCRLGQCAYRSAMIQFRALAGPVLKHGPRSLACVRVIEITKTERRNESEGARSPRARGGWRRGLTVRLSHSRGVYFPICEFRRAQSINAGTRKMVNYAWSGRSQGKP